MKDTTRVEMWLNKAMELEIRGHSFYLDASNQAVDPLVRDCFKFLSDQELVHVEIIKKIRARLGNDASCWLVAEERTSVGQGLGEIFKKMTTIQAGSGKDILAAIDGGIVFETEAQAYYEREIPRAGCEEEKRFLITLAAEENQHRQALADMRLYYTDPEAWLQQMDRGHLDGV